MNSHNRLTVEAHAAFKRSLATPPPADFDEIDLAVCDAEQVLDSRSHREASRVLAILDDLAVEKLRRRNFEERGAE